MSWTKSQFKAIVCGAVLALLVIAILVGVFLRYLAPSNEAGLTSLRFDRSSRVEIDRHPELEFGTGPFTISFWFKTASQQKYLTFISKRVSTMGDGWVIHGQENNTFLFYTAGCASPTSTPQQFRDGLWHQVIFSRATNHMTIFFDGRSVGAGPDPCNHIDNHPIRIGMDAETGWHFEGEIAEVHLYNRALTLEEIAEEWNQGKGRKSAVTGGGLVAGYHFDESGNTAIDFSGKGHIGTLIRQAR